MMNFKDVDITIKRILCEFMGYDVLIIVEQNRILATRLVDYFFLL